MILFKRRYCRKHGHDVDPDPGDFVLHCRRCKATVDMFDLLPADAVRVTCLGCVHAPHEGRPCSAQAIIDSCPCSGPGRSESVRTCGCGCGNPVGDS